MRSLSAKWVRQNIAVVDQDPVLFATSILENILYGSASTSSSASEKEKSDEVTMLCCSVLQCGAAWCSVLQRVAA